MRYVFRINVRGRGYSLYSCEQGGGALQRLPLDVTSPELPAGFIKAQNHIDELLERDPTRPYFWASSSKSSALVLYGCRFPVADEYGRQGLALVHGFHCLPSQILDLVSCVARLVSPDLMVKVGDLVSRIATGRAEPADLVSVFDGLVRRAPFPLYPAVSGAGPKVPLIGAMVHDSGGTVLAWLAMTLAHHRLKQPWVVFDGVENAAIVTMSSERNRGPRYLLSDYIRQAAISIDSALLTTAMLAHSNDNESEPSDKGTDTPPTLPPEQPPVKSWGERPPQTPPRSHDPASQEPPVPEDRQSPWWLRRPAGNVGMALAAVALLTVLTIILLVLRACQETEQTPRSIAQYEYRFTLPDGWLQTDSDSDTMRTEIKPISAAQRDDNRVLVEETRLDFDSGSDQDRALDFLRADLATRGLTLTEVDFSANFAGRDVAHFREILDNTLAVTDWYVLFGGTSQVSVGCQSTIASREQVRRACEVVVRSIVITG